MPVDAPREATERECRSCGVDISNRPPNFTQCYTCWRGGRRGRAEMEGGELKRQRRESSSSIQVTQGDNAPLLVQDSVGPKYFLCWCCFVVCLFSLVFFIFFFFFSSSKFFQNFLLPLLFKWYYTCSTSTLREKTTRNTHTVTRRKEHVSGRVFFLSSFFL